MNVPRPAVVREPRAGGCWSRSTLVAILLMATLPSGSGGALAEEPPQADPRRWTMDRPTGTTIELAGPVRRRLEAITTQWLLPAPESNPALLDMFADRERLPRRMMIPWAGEFAGKYLTGAVSVLRVAPDPKLKATLTAFVRRLLELQADDGYLGPWPKENRLTGKAPNSAGDTWDAWGHYWMMIGLLAWHDETGDQASLIGARRIADLFDRRFGPASGKRLVDTGSTEMNLAPAHSLALLGRRDRDGTRLAQARRIVAEFAAKDVAGKPLAGNYLEAALAGTEFFACPKPRWESLHPMLALSELHLADGDPRYRKAFEHWWWSIAKLDRHNNGGFTSGEQAQGNPYHQGAIETCCTIAWQVYSIDMLRLTGNPRVADELELATLNSGLGMHSPNGRWCTYNTPMDGVRKASFHDIVFQSREGSPELNCCSVNGARSLGSIGDWALMRTGDDLALHWYGPMTATVPDAGGPIKVRVEGDYPTNLRATVIAEATGPGRALRLRIPGWSERTTVTKNGQAIANVVAGTHLRVELAPGTTRIELAFDDRLHWWVGERESAGRVSLYRGPVLLTWDRRFNDGAPDAIPSIQPSAASLASQGRQSPDSNFGGARPETIEAGAPLVLLTFAAEGNRSVRLCDFASAGFGGSPYRSWLPVSGALRSSRMRR